MAHFKYKFTLLKRSYSPSRLESILVCVGTCMLMGRVCLGNGLAVPHIPKMAAEACTHRRAGPAAAGYSPSSPRGSGLRDAYVCLW